MGKLYLRGDKSRGRDVVQTLVSLGGKRFAEDTTKDYYDENFYFYINDHGGMICGKHVDNVTAVLSSIPELIDSYSLVSFEVRWPYKIGDQVEIKNDCLEKLGISSSSPTVGIITEMKWMPSWSGVGYSLDILPEKIISVNCLKTPEKASEKTKDLSAEYKKDDCFVSWDNHSEMLYLMKIKSINFKTGKAVLSYIEIDNTEEYDNKISPDDVKIDNLSTLTKHLSLISKEWGWKKMEDEGEFLKFLELKKEIRNLVRTVKSKARKK